MFRRDSKYCREQRERKSKERHHGEILHDVVLFGGEQGVVGLAQLHQPLAQMFERVPDALKLAYGGAYAVAEAGAEHPLAVRLERLEHQDVRLERPAEVVYHPAGGADVRHHLALAAGKYPVLYFVESLVQAVALCQERVVEVAHHADKEHSAVLGLAAAQDRVDLERFGKGVQGVYVGVAGGDEEVLADDKVDFGLGPAGEAAQGGEVEHKVEVLAAALGLGLRRGC